MNATRRTLFRWLGILISLLFTGIFIFSILIRETATALIGEEIVVYGFFFVIIGSGLLDLIPQFIAPHAIILQAAVLNLSLYFVIPLVLIGSTLGAAFGFWIGKRHGVGFACELFGEEKIIRVGTAMNSRGKWFVTIAALSPLPYLPILFGSLHMQWRNFIIYGLIPRALSFILLGLFFV